MNNSISFAKHQTFAFRESWIPKALEQFQYNEDTNTFTSDIFKRNDSKYLLGLGTNMIDSLKFWVGVLGIAEESSNLSGKQLTKFGEFIKRFDPYLEHQFTLFIVHYFLVSNCKDATTWYYFFNEYRPINFSRQDMLKKMKAWMKLNYNSLDYKDSTLIKDINCLIQLYSNREDKNNPEDSIFCPFSSLGFITEHLDESKTYKFNHLSTQAINPLVILYVIIDRLNKDNYLNGEIEVDDLINKSNNVGKVFHLTSFEIIPLINQMEKEYSEFKIKIVRTAGLNYIRVDLSNYRNIDNLIDYDKLLCKILERYYEK